MSSGKKTCEHAGPKSNSQPDSGAVLAKKM